MGLKDRLRALKREMRGDLESFVLDDGSLFYFDPTGLEVFLHSMTVASW